MKLRPALWVLGSLLAGTAYADRITWDEVPAAVQQSIRARSDRNIVDFIDREKRSDQVIYRVAWRSSIVKREMLLSETGTILRDAVSPAIGGSASQQLTLANKSDIALTDTPLPVQNSIREELRGAGIEAVEKGIWNGQTIYQAAYTKEGQRVLYQVNEAGESVTPKSEKNGFQPKYAGLARGKIKLETPAKMAYLYAPEPVRETVRHFADNSEVEDFRRGLWNGKTVFEASFRKNGEKVDLQLLEDGSLLTRPPAGAVGAPAPTATGGGQQQP